MTNKEIYALAGQVARQLKQSGLVQKIPPAKQVIYDNISIHLQKTPNTTYTDITKDTTKKGDGLNPPPELTEEELRVWLKRHLERKLVDGTLQAAEIAQLKDIFGLSRQSDDIHYTLLDFRDTLAECRQCGGNPWREKLPDLPADGPNDPKQPQTTPSEHGNGTD